MEDFTIEDIAQIHGLEVLKRKNEIYAVCPFCGDRRGKFSYTLQKGSRKNVYNCFACGEHGSGVDLHIKLSTDDFSGTDGVKKAINDIKKSLGTVSDRPRTPKYIAPKEAKKASEETCSKVYYQMLKLLTLEENHKADLIRRGLTEEDIRRFRFKSSPSDVERFNRQLYFALKKLNLSPKGVPGFYRDRKGFWKITLPGTGYFCPVFNGNKILGFQIRVDNPKKDAKYLWFSSAGKYSGVSSGSPATILRGKHDNKIILIEGILKATVTYSLLKGQFTVIGVPGVNVIESLNPFFSAYKNKGYVFEAYDMDKYYKENDYELLCRAIKEADANALSLEEYLKADDMNPKKEDRKYHSLYKAFRILSAANHLCAKAEEYGLGVHSLTWDTAKLPVGDELLPFWAGEYKGLDDFLVAYSGKDIFCDYLNQKADMELGLKNYLS